ncbi:MAG: TetR/AcrR family transcriptional regulator [Mycolicibacterium cosmeticum]|nr:TetR/AcrR family transcriptional regulator [Mycolicibacterium cosmeticum]
MLDAAGRLIVAKGGEFTTQELVAEAGVALQTFYRYFNSKDELLLAVIGDAMTDACEKWATAAADLDDPLARLRFYVTATLQRLDGAGADGARARFVVSARWQLHRNHAVELAEAERPFVDLLRGEVEAATAAGVLNSTDAERDSWLVAELARSVFHFYTFATAADGELEIVTEKLWCFCLAALGGTAKN